MALPRHPSRGKLTEFFIPMSAGFGGWLARDIVVDLFRESLCGTAEVRTWAGNYGLHYCSAHLFARCGRKIDMGSSLVLHLCLGWWVGFPARWCESAGFT